MNLLFSRSQSRASFLSLIPLRIGGTVTFRLKAELELSDEELALARKYSFTKATLIHSDAAEDLARAYRPAIFLAIIIALVSAFMIPGRGMEGILLKLAAVPAIGFISFIVLTVLYFFSLRKLITVDQLMNGGRMFYCHSVVELDERETDLLDICKRFYLTLEKAKNWGGREINPLLDGEPFYLNNPDGNEHRVVVDRAMYKAGAATRKLMTPFMVNNEVSPTQPPQQSTSSSVPESSVPKPRDPNVPRSSPEHPLHGLLGGADGTGWGDNTSADPASNPPPNPPSPQGHATQQPPTNPTRNTNSNQSSTHPLAPKPPDDGRSGF